MNYKLLEKITKCNLQKVLANKGYAYFDKGKYNLNIIGIRCNNKYSNNAFNDVIVVKYIDENNLNCIKYYTATTTPGIQSLEKPVNNKGTAILVPNQYRGCWTIGKHKNKYEALVQCKPVSVYRDSDKDKEFDMNSKTIDTGMFGINIHKAGTNSTIVGTWSAGCQVFAKEKAFNEFMNLCNKQILNGFGNKFTYTLINERDLE
uniref:Uncharacterized protein n=1 Tax=Geladintestivirus 1 TaxID=3233133 RepID=A0AAU8MJD3_9CAUD